MIESFSEDVTKSAQESILQLYPNYEVSKIDGYVNGYNVYPISIESSYVIVNYTRSILLGDVKEIHIDITLQKKNDS